MCDLCNLDERERAIKDLQHEVEALRRLADKLQLVSEGRIKPHTHDAEGVSTTARHVIRFLVEEWM